MSTHFILSKKKLRKKKERREVNERSQRGSFESSIEALYAYFHKLSLIIEASNVV